MADNNGKATIVISTSGSAGWHLSGFYSEEISAPSAQISVADKLDFGEVVVGVPTTLQLEIMNIGTCLGFEHWGLGLARKPRHPGPRRRSGCRRHSAAAPLSGGWRPFFVSGRGQWAIFVKSGAPFVPPGKQGLIHGSTRHPRGFRPGGAG